MSFSVTSAKREFTPVGHCFIIHLPGGGQCPLVGDSEPIRLLEMPTEIEIRIVFQYSLRSKRFCGFSEQRKTEERDFDNFAAQDR